MLKKNVFWRYPVVIGSVLAMQGLAQAADAPTTAANAVATPDAATRAEATADPAQAVRLKRVQVNAQRRQAQQQTSLASVVDGKELEQDRLYRFEDLSQAVTGVDIAAAD
ncbi:TonB-dependent receptor, partial [Dickeya dianthicola]|nr:TonB-dependent receptor [Dickeya dianthicola]